MQLSIEKLGKVAITIEEDYWSQEKDYDRLTIVEAPNNEYKTYISRKPVPAGTVLTNRKYWLPFSSLTEEIVIDFNAFVTSLTEAMQETKQHTDTVISEGVRDINAIKQEAISIVTYIADNGIDSKVLAPNSVTTEKIADNAVTNKAIAPNAINGDKIVDNSITGDKFIDNTIPGSKLQDGSIQNVDIADNTLSGTKLLDNSINGTKIANNAITANHILDNSIPGEKIADGAIGSVDLKDGSLFGSKLKNNSVDTIKIANGAVTTEKLADGAITNQKIVDLAVTTDKIANGGITTTNINNGAITTAKIADGNITTDKINNGAVSEGKLAAGAVNTSKISDNAVTTDKLANGAVTEGKINSSAVTDDKIANGAITESKISADAVTTAKIVDANVTTDKIADGAVTTAKINNGAITTDKIPNNNITTAKINDGAVTSDKILDNAIITSKIADANVTTTKIANGAITEAKLADGAITTDKIADSAITELTTIMDSIPTEGSVKPVTSGGIKAYVDAATPEVVPMAETLAPWADQKAIATPDTYTDAVRTTGGDIPIETSAGSKLESIKPVAGSKWTAKMLFNGSYNMLNAAKWGAANIQPYVGGVGNDFVYFLVPELTLGTFGTADENNGLLFTNARGENIQPTSVYYKPLGTTVPQSLTDGTSVTPTSLSYDNKTYKTYETSGAGWLIIPKTIYDNDVCAHIAWEDWYDKYVSLDEPTTNPEAVVGVLMLEGLLALAHSDKYLRGVNNEVYDKVVFGDTSATITHMVDELSVAAASWTNSATGESDSQGNALYRHSATVSGIKQGGAACVEGEDGGIPLTVNGTTVSYIDTNAAAPASVVFYEVTATSTTKAYTDSVFSGSNINTETGVLPINDCSIEAQVAMDGMANITVKYAKNIVDQVAINATVDVPQIKREVENHEERITDLEDTAVRTGSYDASVAVGLADNFKGDTIVDAEFYKRKTGGTQSVGSGIAAIKEVRGKSIVWNQLAPPLSNIETYCYPNFNNRQITIVSNVDGVLKFTATRYYGPALRCNCAHKIYLKFDGKADDNIVIRTGFTNTQNAAVYVDLKPVDITNEWKSVKKIHSGGNNECLALVFFGRTTDIETAMYVRNIQLIDLTLMFGAGNEPATVEEFEKMFPLDYYDYNAGEVIPFAGQNLTTTGKNQYNPATGKANLLGGQTYQIGGTYISAEIDGVAVTLDSNDCFTTTKDCVLEITDGNDTDTFVGLYNGETNTYEPYEKHTLPIDPSQWRDKQGNLVFPHGGMHGVGTAYDYAKVDADGYIRKAVRCFGQVDLGSMNYDVRNSHTYRAGVSSMKTNTSNILLPIYTHIYSPSDDMLDKTYSSYGERIFIGDYNFTDDTSAFKAAMQGVPLIYELDTPVEVELATPVYAKYLVDKDGTEEITPANGTTPYTTMANLSILYAMDARGEIKNLPKNYLSKESTENMLNAMVTAGIIASYTMTWDSTNNRYAFTFTKAEQASTNTVNNESNI